MNAHHPNLPSAAPVNDDLGANRDWLAARLAGAMAKLDGEIEPFLEGRSDDAPAESAELRAEYLADARDILEATGLFDSLALSCKLMAPGTVVITEKMNLDQIEAFIARRMENLQSVELQLQGWEDGRLHYRDEEWAMRARKALDKIRRDIAFGHKLRLKVMRNEDFAEVVAGRDQYIAQLTEAKRQERAKRLHITGRLAVEIATMKALLRERAPGLVDEMYARLDEAVTAYDAQALRETDAQAQSREAA